MITLEKALHHMSWSNYELFLELANLPDEIYTLRAHEGEWPVGKILNHFLDAGQWYRYLLTQTPWTENAKIVNAQGLLEMREQLREIDRTLIEALSVDDGIIIYTNDSGHEQKTFRSIVLTQAVVHTAEHKGQLATILRQHGFTIELDKYDVWNLPK